MKLKVSAWLSLNMTTFVSVFPQIVVNVATLGEEHANAKFNRLVYNINSKKT